MVPPSEHSMDVAEPCLPGSQACGLEDSEPGRSWPGQRKEEEVLEGQRRRRGDGHQSYQEAVGPGGDTLELDGPGQVIHQSFSFLICAMGLIPDLCQLNE